jgi:hypothetical protein
VVVRSQDPVCARGSNPQCPGACARLHVCRGQARETIARTRRKPMHYQPTPPFKRQHEESGISARCQPGARSLVRSIGTLQLYSCMLKLLKVQSMRAPRAERFGACNIPSNIPHGKERKKHRAVRQTHTPCSKATVVVCGRAGGAMPQGGGIVKT